MRSNELKQLVNALILRALFAETGGRVLGHGTLHLLFFFVKETALIFLDLRGLLLSCVLNFLFLILSLFCFFWCFLLSSLWLLVLRLVSFFLLRFFANFNLRFHADLSLYLNIISGFFFCVFFFRLVISDLLVHDFRKRVSWFRCLIVVLCLWLGVLYFLILNDHWAIIVFIVVKLLIGVVLIFVIILVAGLPSVEPALRDIIVLVVLVVLFLRLWLLLGWLEESIQYRRTITVQNLANDEGEFVAAFVLIALRHDGDELNELVQIRGKEVLQFLIRAILHFLDDILLIEQHSQRWDVFLELVLNRLRSLVSETLPERP